MPRRQVTNLVQLASMSINDNYCHKMTFVVIIDDEQCRNHPKTPSFYRSSSSTSSYRRGSWIDWPSGACSPAVVWRGGGGSVEKRSTGGLISACPVGRTAISGQWRAPCPRAGPP